MTGLLSTLAMTMGASLSLAQQPVDSPAARMRPIGSPSAVDQYRRPSASPRFSGPRFSGPRFSGSSIRRETKYQRSGPGLPDGHVRQTAMQFEIPGGASPFAPPSAGPLTPPAQPSLTPHQPALSPAPLPPGPLPSQPLPSQPLPSQPAAATLPRQSSVLPRPGVAPNPLPAPGLRADHAPMNAPVLSNQFATVNNCAAVSGPSSYSAACASGCGSACAPVGYQAPAYQAPPAQIPAPALMPTTPFGAPALTAPAALNPAPIGSLMTFGQQRYPVQVGQGLLGQPKAYVPGQTLRNWLRYFTP